MSTGGTTVFAAIDYGYSLWEKLWPVGCLLAAIVTVKVTARPYKRNKTEGYLNYAEDNVLWGTIVVGVIVVIGIAVPLINRNTRVTDKEFQREERQLVAHAERNGYEVLYVDANDDEFTVNLDGCRLPAFYTQEDEAFDTYLVDFRQIRGREFHFDNAQDLRRSDFACTDAGSSASS
jgi:hypothetical protein